MVCSLECQYPMYLMRVKDILKLEQFEPHQIMLRKGLVHEWAPHMCGRVIFISHEWLGWAHADPQGEQFTTLKRVLERLCKGEIPKVESYWMQELLTKKKTSVSAKEWKDALPHMFVWMDFLCIPQPCFHTGGSLDATPSSEEASETFTNLTKAVESIPAYLERTSLLLILVLRAAVTPGFINPWFGIL